MNKALKGHSLHIPLLLLPLDLIPWASSLSAPICLEISLDPEVLLLSTLGTWDKRREVLPQRSLALFPCCPETEEWQPR